jgi:hypothetical protein
MLELSQPEDFNIEDIKLAILSRIYYLMDLAWGSETAGMAMSPRPISETQELIKLDQAMQALEKEV